MPGIHPDFIVFAADPRNTVRPPPAHVPLHKLRAAADAAMVDHAPPTIARIEEGMVASDGVSVPVRLYRTAADGTLPLIVFAHGGGFVWGSIDTHDGICRRLALASGAAVLSIGYRLAPEAPFPAAMRDVLTVIDALPGLSERWQIDPTRLAFCGDSAGGHVMLTAALALRGAPLCPLALALIYPAVDPSCESDSQHRLADGPVLTQAGMRWFWHTYLGEQSEAPPTEATPLNANLSGLPPTLIVTAEHDPLRDEGTALAARLDRQGVSATLHLVDGAVHGFLSASLDAALSRVCISTIAGFVTNQEHLR
ncbi:alpha/beta hydrolase [Pontitalea aquivivens]|uniref:alpha/beta hydrolase n=1 Tax=Pontitalea aquivivens TaxID=3388663 RepID=UPI003970B69E